MRMFIKTEHGPEAPTPAHPFDLPPCKLNTPVYLLGHFSQFVRVLSLVLSVWILRPQPKRQSSFVCLSFATLRLYCAQLLAGHEKEKTTHCIFIYGYPLLPTTPTSITYIFVRYKSSVPTSIFSDFGCLILFPHL